MTWIDPHSDDAAHCLDCVACRAEHWPQGIPVATLVEHPGVTVRCHGGGGHGDTVLASNQPDGCRP